MSLSRQLISIVSLMFLVVFAGTFYTTVDNTRQYLSTQLGSHAQDTATSLGLTLSHNYAEDDLFYMRSTVDAIFDRGDYQEILVTSVDGRALIDRSSEVTVNEVPEWFIRWLPLVTPSGEADILRGWKKGGQVKVTSHAGYAYAELWRSSMRSLWWCIGTLVVTVLIAGTVLRVKLKPLAAIEAQAIAITNGEFPTLQEIPRTRELKRVMLALNKMVTKVQQMLTEQTEAAERMREKAYTDPVTGAGNRRSLSQRLAHLVNPHGERHFGALMLVRVAGLDAVNRSHGFAGGDELLRDVAARLTAGVSADNGFVARLGGAEFGVLLPDLTQPEAAQIAQDLLRKTGTLQFRDAPDLGLHVGMSYFSGSQTTFELMSEADMALRSAERKGPAAWHMFEAKEPAAAVEVHGAEQWRSILHEAIDTQSIVLLSQPVKTPDLNSVLHHEVFARLRGERGDLIPAGVFMPMAERLGLATQLDKVIVRKLLNQIDRDVGDESRYAVNLAPASIIDLEFADWLLDTLKQRTGLAARLSFEVPEHAARSDLSRVGKLASRLRELRVQFALDHFGVGSMSFGYLRDLKIDYVKIDGSYVSELNQHTDSQLFLKLITDVAHGHDIRVIAEYVEQFADCKLLRELNVDGLQGYFVGKPEAWHMAVD